MANFPSNTQVYGYPLSRISLLLIFFFLLNQGFSQKKLSSDSKKALRSYEKAQTKSKERDFESALALLSNAIKRDPAFYEAYLRKGSLFNAMGSADSVYSNFSKYLELTPFPIPSVLNKMASMAFERGFYNKSQEFLNEVLRLNPRLSSDREIELLQESLKFAKKELQNGLQLEIVPLPVEINKFSLQYLPSITIDNSTLIYTKRDFIEGDEDIVVSYFKEGSWTDAQSVSSRINSPLNEGACTISADGRTMIFTSCDKRDSFGSCDLYISRKTGESWSRPKNLGKSINSHYWESQPSLSADGRTLYFSSNRPGGNGGRDLWVSNFEEPRWTKPKNLGNKVNTFKDETTPFIHPNGETLFFSSNGHIGMGGFDLVRSDRIDSSWTEVENLGYPTNSFNDEVALLIGGDGKTAYFAKEIQKDYRIVDSKIVTFVLPDSQKVKPATYIVGKVLDNGSGKPIKAEIEVIDLDKNEVLYQASSDSLLGNYTMVLPSDKELACYIKKQGYLFYEYNFYSESNSITQPDTIEIKLRPISVNASLVLRNVYFESNSYELNSKSLSEISNIVQVLNENPNIHVEISGHTDNSGSDAYNLLLSENRSREVFNELIKKRIHKNRIEYRGYGDTDPIESNDSAEGRQSNRRIEFKILKIIP